MTVTPGSIERARTSDRRAPAWQELLAGLVLSLAVMFVVSRSAGAIHDVAGVLIDESATSTSGTAPALDGRVDDSEREGHTIYSDHVESIDIVEAALARFESAGLALEAIDFRFHSDIASCRGNKGLHTEEDGRHRIDLCVRGPIERLVLHEIGHSWISDNLGAEERATLLELRDLRVWNDRNVRWGQRGTEHAAEILAWGLSERCMAGWVHQHDAPTLQETFLFLTGAQPICEDVPPVASQPRSSDRGGRVQK